MKYATKIIFLILISTGLFSLQARPTSAAQSNCLTADQIQQDIQSIESETNNEISQIKEKYAAIAQQQQSETNANLWASGMAGSGTAVSQMATGETSILQAEDADIANIQANEMNQENEVHGQLCSVQDEFGNQQGNSNYSCPAGEVFYGSMCLPQSLYDIAYCRNTYGASYKYDSTSNSCVPAYCPPNSFPDSTPSTCTCYKGYVWDSQSYSCVKSPSLVPPTSIPTSTEIASPPKSTTQSKAKMVIKNEKNTNILPPGTLPFQPGKNLGNSPQFEGMATAPKMTIPLAVSSFPPSPSFQVKMAEIMAVGGSFIKGAFNRLTSLL